MSTETIALHAVGERIRRLRVENGLSQEDVAAPAFTAAYLSHVEHGKRRPSQRALSHIADRLGVTVEQLLSGRDPNEDLRIEIEIQSAIADMHQGHPQRARRRLEAARVEAERAGHERALLRADEGLGLALYRLGQVDAALYVFESADARCSHLAPEERTTVRVGWARCLFQNGDIADALHLLEGHLRDLESADPPDPTSLLQTYAALIPPYCESGLTARAQEMTTRGWKLAPQVGDPEGRGCLYVNRAGLLLNQGDKREAMASLALAEDQFRQLGWHSETVTIGLMRALVLIETDKPGQAETLLQDLLSQHGDAVSGTDRAQALAHLARSLRLQGKHEDARQVAAQALTDMPPGLPAVAAEIEREAGLAAVAEGNEDEAVHRWRKALRLFQEVGHKEDVAKTARLIGDLLIKTGEVNEAAAAYRQGLDAMGELR